MEKGLSMTKRRLGANREKKGKLSKTGKGKKGRPDLVYSRGGGVSEARALLGFRKGESLTGTGGVSRSDGLAKGRAGPQIVKVGGLSTCSHHRSRKKKGEAG